MNKIRSNMLKFIEDANLYLSLNKAKTKLYTFKQKHLRCDDYLQEFTLLTSVIEQHGGSVGQDDALTEFEVNQGVLKWSKPTKPTVPRNPGSEVTPEDQAR